MKGYFSLLLAISQCWLLNCQRKPPHIIFIYADDLGWNDVSFHGSSEIPTPNIDALAMSGILLNNYYGFHLCTPSRAAFLTAKHPIRLGLQHHVLLAGEASGLPLSAKTLPEYLKRLGYQNHMVGKWHLGYMTKAYTPTYRGFDSYFGYWNGNMDYFDHVKFGDTSLKEIPYFYGIDLHNGTNIARDFRGKYATDLFTEVAEEIIRKHDTSIPMFLYVAHMAPHTGNSFKPLQAPPKYVKRMEHIQDRDKRLYGAMISALDESVGNIFKCLHQKNMLEDSIIVFASDNGAETRRTISGLGSNFPLRGNKFTLWEGGTRLPAVIWSPLFKLKEPRISMQLMHVVDWLPTFYEAAGGNLNDLDDINGKSMWQALIEDLPSPRNHLLYNIDPTTGTSALRIGNMKLINGSMGYDSWYSPTSYKYYISKLNNYKYEDSIVQSLLSQSGKWIVKNPDEWREKAIVACYQPPPPKTGNCKPSDKPCLFNLASDPCEYYNMAELFPKVADCMMKSIIEMGKLAAEPQAKSSDPRANPDCHDFSFVPWLESEHYNECYEYL